jgi:hypothetical protein
LVTLYDVFFDRAAQHEVLHAPNPVGFEEHVKPILARGLGYQWVNKQARLGYSDTGNGGHGPTGGAGVFDLTSPRLRDPGQPPFPRQQIFRLLREPGRSSTAPNTRRRMPRLNDDQQSGDVMPLSPTQYRIMKSWVDGQFQPTVGAAREELPEALTRVALEACAGGAFFPGIEVGRFSHGSENFMPRDPFRIMATSVVPGQVTENNAVPWQADFHVCRWEKGDELGWWPAQRPDDVLKTEDGLPVDWGRGLADVPQSWVDHWHRLGFVMSNAVGNAFVEKFRDPNLDENGQV